MNRHYNRFCNRYGLDPFDEDSVYLWEQSLPTYTEDEIEWARMGGIPDKSIADPAEGIVDGLLLLGGFLVIIIALA